MAMKCLVLFCCLGLLIIVRGFKSVFNLHRQDSRLLASCARTQRQQQQDGQHSSISSKAGHILTPAAATRLSLASCVTELENDVNDEEEKEYYDEEFEYVDDPGYAYGAESHPLDDPEPPLIPEPTVPQLPTSSLFLQMTPEPKPNPFGIPRDPKGEWDWYLEKLRLRQEAIEKFGNYSSIVSNTRVEDGLLNFWMAKQRRRFMKTMGILDPTQANNFAVAYLTRREKEQLDDVGFFWGYLNDEYWNNDRVYHPDFQRSVRYRYKDWSWIIYYDRLVHFYAEHAHTRVPLLQDNKDSNELALWVLEQCQLKDEMQARRREKLDRIGFDWDYRDDSSKGGERYHRRDHEPVLKQVKNKQGVFATRMKQLKEYRRKHDNCEVPLDYDEAYGLGEWVQEIKNRQPNEFALSTLLTFQAMDFQFNGKNSTIKE